MQFDIKNQRVFLRRIAYPSIDVEHLFLGGTVLVYTRTLVLEEFGDEFTRKRLGSQVQSYVSQKDPEWPSCEGAFELEFLSSSAANVFMP